MEEKIIKQLKMLKTIEPEEEFLTKSKLLLLAKITEEKIEKDSLLRKYFRLSFAGALALFLIFFLFIGQMLKNKELPIASADTLSKEFENLSIKFELENINYSTEANKTIAKTIKIITNEPGINLDSGIIEKELKIIDSTTSSDYTEIDNLLNDLLRE